MPSAPNASPPSPRYNGERPLQRSPWPQLSSVFLVFRFTPASGSLHLLMREGSLFFLFIYLFILLIYFWLRWVFVAVRAFSSCGERGLLFVAVRGLLIVVAFLAVEHGL